MIRIQFDIDEEVWERVKRYSPNYKLRHEVGREALEEWVNRREGRDKKLKRERIIADMDTLQPLIQEMINNGRLRIG